MRNIERAFRNHTRIDKIRVAKFVTSTINSNLPEITNHDGSLNTVLGLLEKGDINCAGEEITGNLFDSSDATESNQTRVARQPNEIAGTGIVQTEEEKKKAEEDARRRREEEEEAERQRLAEEEAEARRIKRENSPLNKFLKSIRKFGTKILEDESE